jgi:hypothetical protein
MGMCESAHFELDVFHACSVRQSCRVDKALEPSTELETSSNSSFPNRLSNGNM